MNNYSYFTEAQKKERWGKKIENAKKLAKMLKELEEEEI
jgi:hypothetical protein